MKTKKHFSVLGALTVLSVAFIGFQKVNQDQTVLPAELLIHSENSQVVGPHLLPPDDLRPELFDHSTSVIRVMEYLEHSSYTGASGVAR